MSDDESATEDTGPVPGPGVTDWLAQVVGTPRASKAASRPWLPPGFGPETETVRRIELLLPEDVVVAEGGNLQRVEIRGLPDGVRLASGMAMRDGFWHLAPDDLYGLVALVPDDVPLPFSVMLKGVFVGDDPETPWSELAGFEINGTDTDEVLAARDKGDPSEAERKHSNMDAPPAAPESAAPAAVEESPLAAPEPIPMPPGPELSPVDAAVDTAPPLTMVVIDLDVSVGTDDPAVLKDISVAFSGLPTGAMLSCGASSGGTWTVPAADLSNLSIFIPEDTPDFELDVEMAIAGSDPQTAAIQVENPSVRINPDDAFRVSLAGDPGAGPTRMFVFTDGSVAYDRVINWPAAPNGEVELLVPYIDSGMPFEILMRYENLGAGEGTPALRGLEIDDTIIDADSPAISASGVPSDLGRIWSGDLVLDVREALKMHMVERDESSLENDNALTAHEPHETAEPTLSDAPGEMTEEVGPAEPDRVLTSNETEYGETETAQRDAPEDRLADNDAKATLQSAAEPAADDTKESNVLVVDATFEDLQRPAFITELRQLRDFIRTQSSDENGEIYARLGIDVAKWHDMTVRGPSGANVELEPLLPRIGPLGGIDNSRDFLPLRLQEFSAAARIEVRLSGLPPGSLLTHGENLGGGIWHLSARDCEDVLFLPPIGRTGATVLHISQSDDAAANADYTPHKSLVVDQSRKRSGLHGTDMPALNLTLEPAVFDPDGHGALSLTLGELPVGAVLSSGKNHGGGVWTLEATPGDTLTIHAAVASPAFEITLTCVALNAQTGASSVVSRVIEVNPTKMTLKLRTDMAA